MKILNSINVSYRANWLEIIIYNVETHTTPVNYITRHYLHQIWLIIIRGVVQGLRLYEKGVWNTYNPHARKDGITIIMEWHQINVSYHSIMGWHWIYCLLYTSETFCHKTMQNLKQKHFYECKENVIILTVLLIFGVHFYLFNFYVF